MTCKKRIVETVISIVLICAMGVSFVMLSSYTEPDGHNRDNIRGFYAEKENSLDMIYIGGSACFVYWEALRAWNEYGYTSYSFAADTLTPQSIKYLIQEGMKTQNPKLWVIDLRPFQYGDEPFSSTEPTWNMYYEAAIRNVTDSLQYSEQWWQLINSSVPDISDRLEYYVPLFKYHSQVTSSLISDVLSVLQGEITVDEMRLFERNQENRQKGFYFNIDTAPIDFADYSDVSEIKPLEGVVNECFIDLLEYCKESAITPLFVVHSYAQKEEHKQKYNYMKQVIDSYGFDFMNTNDYYREIGFDYSFDFYNENHVNIYGAEKYTDFLAAYIAQQYNMPDHRLDSAYAQWDICAAEFEILVEENKQAIRSLESGK